MKQKLLSILAVLLIVPLSIAAADFEFTVGEITYYAMTDSTATVYDCQTEETAIDIPETVTYKDVEYTVCAISSYGFYYCESLVEVTIPATVNYIGDLPFSNCDALQAIYVEETNEAFCAVDGILYDKEKTEIVVYPVASSVVDLVLPETIKSIRPYAFCGAGSILSLALPDGLETIGEYAFYYCTALGNITLPETLTSLGEGAFYACQGFTEFTLPSQITVVPSNLLSFSNALVTINLTGEVTAINDYALRFCYGLEAINLPESLKTIGTYAFAYCRVLYDIAIPDGVSSIAAYAFYECNAMTTVNIPEGITAIEESTFCNCTSLTSIGLPSTLSTVGVSAFSGCSAVETIEMPEGLTTISASAFRECKKVTSLALPEGLKTIDEWAFRSCTGLTELYIPVSVTTLGDYSFSYCTSLSEVSVNSSTPLAISDYVFYLIASNPTLYVPVGTKTAYSEATGWKRFTTITEDETLSIATVENDKLTIAASAGAIRVAGAAAGTPIAVYDVSGSLVYSGVTTDAYTTISLPTALYIVSVGNASTTRVVVK